MKIAIDGRSAFFYSGSGIGNYSLELIKNLFKINKDYVIDILSNEVDIKREASFWETSNYPIILNSNKKYDILLNPHNGIGLPNKTSYKIITTLHDIIPSKLPETVSKSYLKIYNQNIINILEKSDSIITVSKYSKEDISKTFNIDKNKIFITYLAPSKIYKSINKDKSKEILKIFYSINFEYVLYIGSFSPRKNILGLIQAFSLICDKNQNIKLLIVGVKGKSYELYLNECIKLKILNKVIFTDFIITKHLPYLYNCASCFIYPSFYEGFGLPPLEAMACGTPTISSNVTSMPEILSNAPLYINPHDIYDIADKLNLVLNDEFIKKTLSLNGLTHVKNFSWEKTSKETLDIILN